MFIYLFANKKQKIQMSKLKEKKRKYNQDVLDRLQEKYGLSRYFITESLRGRRTSETSEKVVSDYNKMLMDVNKALKK
jgi:hypothetical protein